MTSKLIVWCMFRLANEGLGDLGEGLREALLDEGREHQAIDGAKPIASHAARPTSSISLNPPL